MNNKIKKRKNENEKKVIKETSNTAKIINKSTKLTTKSVKSKSIKLDKSEDTGRKIIIIYY